MASARRTRSPIPRMLRDKHSLPDELGARIDHLSATKRSVQKGKVVPTRSPMKPLPGNRTHVNRKSAATKLSPAEQEAQDVALLDAHIQKLAMLRTALLDGDVVGEPSSPTGSGQTAAGGGSSGGAAAESKPAPNVDWIHTAIDQKLNKPNASPVAQPPAPRTTARGGAAAAGGVTTGGNNVTGVRMGSDEPAYGPGCVAVGTGLTQTYLGLPSFFTLQARTRAGVPRTEGGDRYTVQVRGPSRVVYAVHDNLDGTQFVSYVSNVTGTYTVDVRLGKSHIQGSPFRVVAHTVQSSAAASQCFGPGCSDPMAAGEATEFTIRAFDRFGNEKSYGGDTLEFRLEEGSAPTVATAMEVLGYTLPGSPTDVVALNKGKIVTTGMSQEAQRRANGPLTLGHLGATGGHGGGGNGIAVSAPTGDPFKDAVFDISDEGDGTYGITYSCTRAGVHSLHVTMDGKTGPKSPFPVTVLPSSLCLASSDKIGNGARRGRAGHKISFTIGARDRHGNVIPSTGPGMLAEGESMAMPLFTLEDQQCSTADVMPVDIRLHKVPPFTVAGADAPPSPSRVDATQQQQIFEVTYTAFTAGTYSLNLGSESGKWKSTPGALQALLDVEVVPGDTQPSRCRALRDAMQRVVAYDGAATFDVVAHDGTGNRKTVGGDNFDVTIAIRQPGAGPHTPTIPCAVTITDNGDGSYTVMHPVTVASPEYVTCITLDGLHISGSPFTGAVVPGAVDTAKTTFDGNPCGTSGSLLSATPWPDEDDEDVAGQGMYGDGGMYGAAGVVERTAEEEEARMNRRRCSYVIRQGTCGQAVRLTITARDHLDNVQTAGGEMFVASLSGVVEAAPGMSTTGRRPAFDLATPEVTDMADGTYVVSYMVRTEGEYTTQVSLNNGVGLEVASAQDGLGPWISMWRPGAVSPAQTSVAGTGILGSARFPAVGRFTIQARDKFGNKVTGARLRGTAGGPAAQNAAAGRQVVTINRPGSAAAVAASAMPTAWGVSAAELTCNLRVAMAGPSELKPTIVQGPGGTFEVTYQGEISGVYTVSVMINGKHCAGSQFLTAVTSTDEGSFTPAAALELIDTSNVTTLPPVYGATAMYRTLATPAGLSSGFAVDATSPPPSSAAPTPQQVLQQRAKSRISLDKAALLRSKSASRTGTTSRSGSTGRNASRVDYNSGVASARQNVTQRTAAKKEADMHRQRRVAEGEEKERKEADKRAKLDRDRRFKEESRERAAQERKKLLAQRTQKAKREEQQAKSQSAAASPPPGSAE